MFRSNIPTTTPDHQMSDSTKRGLNRPEYNITITMDTGTPNGGHNTLESSDTMVDIFHLFLQNYLTFAIPLNLTNS